MAGKGTKKTTRKHSLMGYEPQTMELTQPNIATQSVLTLGGIAYARPKNEKPFEVKKRRNKKPQQKKEIALEQYDFNEAIDWEQVLKTPPAVLSEQEIKKQQEEIRKHREARKRWLTENLKHRRSHNAGQRFYIDKPKKPKTNFFSAVYSPQTLSKYKKPKTQKAPKEVKPIERATVKPVVKEFGLLDIAMNNLMDMWGQPKPQGVQIKPEATKRPTQQMEGFAQRPQQQKPIEQRPVEQKPIAQKPPMPDINKKPLPQLTAAKREQEEVQPIIKPISGQMVESEPKPSLRERILERRKQDVLKMPVVVVTGEKFTMRDRYANDPVAFNAAIVPVVDNRTAILNRAKDPNHKVNAKSAEFVPRMPKKLRYYPSSEVIKKDVTPPEVEFTPNYSKIEDGEQPQKANFFKTKRAQSAVGEWQNFVVDEDKREFSTLHEELLQGLIEDIERNDSEQHISEPPKVEPIADLGKIIEDITKSDQTIGQTVQLEKLIESIDNAMHQKSGLSEENKLDQLLGEEQQADLNEQFAFFDNPVESPSEAEDLDAQLMALLSEMEEDGFVDEDGTGIDDNLERIVHGMVEEAIDDVDHTYEHGYVDEDGTGIDDNLERIVHGMVEEAIDDVDHTYEHGYVDEDGTGIDDNLERIVHCMVEEAIEDADEHFSDVEKEPLAIKVEGLRKSIDGKNVLDTMDFEIERGEIAAIYGGKGAGKTTLLSAIAGQTSIDEGKVSIFSHDITNKSVQKLIGAIVSPPQFMEQMSVRENIKYYASLHFGVTEERLLQAADLVGLTDYLTERVKKLTADLRFRLAVAQAILHKPKLLVLDEPTSLIEPQDICNLRDFLTMVADSEDITIVLSTAVLCEVQLLSDSVIILKDGKMEQQLFVADMNSHDIKKFELEVSDFRKAAKLLQKQLGIDVTIDKKRLVFDLPENALKTVAELLLNSEIRILQ